MKSKHLIALLLIIISTFSFAQKKKKSYILVQGEVKQRIDKITKFKRIRKKYDTKKLGNVNITIFMDNEELFKSISDEQGSYEVKFNMKENHIYTVKFEKEGFYPRIVDFDTKKMGPGKQLKVRNWNFYLYKKIENVDDKVFFNPYKMDYNQEYNTMSYRFAYNEKLDIEQEKMYIIYREYELNATRKKKKDGSTAIDPSALNIIKGVQKGAKSRIQDIKRDLYHSQSAYKEDSILNVLKINIHTQKAALEIDKLKAQSFEDRMLIKSREQEIQLAETQILLAEQEIENGRKKLQLKQAESKAKNNLIIFFLIIMAALVVLIFVIVRSARERKKINLQLKHRNEIIIGKNNEILDSIKYSKRIQRAILPSLETVRKMLPNSFIVYLPKDIVSGDFYWIETVNDKIHFAAVDCTGHGVPGAFMSIIGYNGLNQSYKAHPKSSPAKILDLLNKNVSSTLRQQEEDATVRDGMDISLCSLDLDHKNLEFSGGHNHLYILRNGEFLRFEADHQPVGTFAEDP